MSAREALKKLIEELPEERLQEMLNFGEFLNWQEERAAWQTFGRGQLAQAYGPNEPEYTVADLKSELNS